MNRAAATREPPATAWFGKLPSRGDFVCGGLGPAQQQGWDGWIQRGLKCAAQAWGQAECERRLRGFVPWRFLVWPDGLDRAAVGGVLVPSQDRVGRAYPLLLLQPYVPDSLAWRDIEAALARLSDLALDLTDLPGVDDYEALLRGAGPVFTAAPQAQRDAAGLHPQELAPQAMLRASGDARSLWWIAPAPGAAPLPLGDGWPPHDELMLDILASQPGLA